MQWCREKRVRPYLSNVCFSRARQPIRPNVYEPGQEVAPSANVAVISGNQGETGLALAQAREHADLKRIAVFDTSVARSLLVESNPLGFKPIGFDVFPELARIVAAAPICGHDRGPRR
jgi:hypothetical protein